MLGRRFASLALGAVACLIVVGGAARAAQPQKGQTTDRLHLDSGAKIILELQTPVNTTTAREGDRVMFVTVREIEAEGKTAIPKGSTIGATVVKVKAARNSGRAEIEFRLDALQFDDGTKIPLTTSNINAKAEKDSGGGGGVIPGIQRGMGQAVQGAVLGALFGGRKTAGIGAALALGTEVLGQTVMKPRKQAAEMDLTQGSIFEVKLSRALDIPARLAAVPPPAAAIAAAEPRPEHVNAATVNRPLKEETEIAIANTRNTDSRPTAATATAGAGGERSIGPAPIVEEAPSASVPLITIQTDAETSAAPESTIALATPSNEPPAFRLSVDVSLAQIDTVVRDRSGKPLDNLKVTDFRLFEDGVEKSIQTFSKDELPLALALVVDRSASVAPFMRSIQDAAYKALAQLKSGDAACLFAFGGTIEMRHDLTTELQSVANAIGTIQNESGTLQIDALYEALEYLERVAPDRRRAVIMISDNEVGNFGSAGGGFPTRGVQRGQGNQHSIQSAVRLAQQTETVVYSVEMEGGSGSVIPLLIPTQSLRGSAEQITDPTGGEVFEVSSSSGGSIQKALATAIGRLKTRYTLGYSPSDASEHHSIEVRLVERFGRPKSDYTVLARTSQYGTPQASVNRRR